MENKYFASIEFSLLHIRICVVSYFHNSLYVVAKSEVDCKGYNNGEIKDQELFELSLQNALKEISDKYKINVDEVILVLPCVNHRSYTAVVQNKVLTERQIVGYKQIQGVRTRIKSAKVAEDEILVEEIPFMYMLDNDRVLRTPPINVQSSTIAIKSTIHTLPKELVYRLNNVLTKNNIKVIGQELMINAGAFLTADEFDLENECVHINIGEEVTTLGSYSKGSLQKTRQIKFGVNNLINYLAQTLKVEKEEALDLYQKYFICNCDYANDFVFDKQRNLSEKRICGILLNELINNGFKTIVDEIKLFNEEVQFVEQPIYLLTGLLNDVEFFVSEFSKYTNLNVKEGNFDVIGFDGQGFLNTYGSIVNFISKNKEFVDEKINSNEDVSVNKEDGTVTVTVNVPSSKGNKFKDIFDD